MNILLAFSHLTQSQKICLGSAALFVILGAGNITYGNYKTKLYREVLSESIADPTIPKLRKADALILNRTVNLNKEIQHISKIRARMGYYQLVVAGGKCFLALAGVLLLASVLLRVPSKAETPEQDTR